MGAEVIVAILALVGTLIGSITGILVANKLVNFRLDNLEKKVEKHNQVVERMALAERDIHEVRQAICNIVNDIKEHEHEKRGTD